MEPDIPCECPRVPSFFRVGPRVPKEVGPWSLGSYLFFRAAVSQVCHRMGLQPLGDWTVA